MRLRTQYADSEGCSIAYQVIGDGPVDVFFLQGLLSHLDMQWCDPIFSAFLHRLAVGGTCGAHERLDDPQLQPDPS